MLRVGSVRRRRKVENDYQKSRRLTGSLSAAELAVLRRTAWVSLRTSPLQMFCMSPALQSSQRLLNCDSYFHGASDAALTSLLMFLFDASALSLKLVS